MTDADFNNADNLWSLAIMAGKISSQIAVVLKGPVTNEAQRLLDEGFSVTDPQALLIASTVFANLGSRPEARYQFNVDDCEARINLLCMFSAHLDALREQIDLLWSSAWAQFVTGQTRSACLSIQKVAQRWNAGEQASLAAEMAVARESAYKDWVYRR